jgi:hypothetical protein
MCYRISALAQNLQTELKEGFSERMHHIEALPRQLQYTK